MADGEQAGNPRLSVEERYQSRDQYVKLVQEAAAPLVKDGYLLSDDVPAIVKHAGEHWDLLAGQSTRTKARGLFYGAKAGGRGGSSLRSSELQASAGRMQDGSPGPKTAATNQWFTRGSF